MLRTLTTAVIPFGMPQFSPDTPTASPSGYRDRDRTIESFSLTHFNGAGCPNNEDIPILPITGNLGASLGSSWTSYASAYTKSNESATHSGLGGENTTWNTAAFTVSTSTDGTTFSSAVTVTASKSSRSYLPVTARSARYVRFETSQPAADTSAAARIYELEVYGSSSAPADVVLNRPAAADSSCARTRDAS